MLNKHMIMAQVCLATDVASYEAAGMSMLSMMNYSLSISSRQAVSDVVTENLTVHPTALTTADE